MSYCDMPKFFNSKTGVKSRKDRRCCECSVPIPAGEAHWVGSGCWSDGIETYRQHLACKEACTTIRDINDGECIAFGELFEYAHDYATSGTKKDELTQQFRNLFARVQLRSHRWFQARRRQKQEAARQLICQVRGAYA